VVGATAVLNADDPHVIAMAEGFRGRVLTLGCSPGAILRAEDVRSPWPERLSFTLHFEALSLPVRTRLCGKHWVSSALAALGATVAMEMPIERAIDALAEVAPAPGRMSPVSRGGVTFICDDFKAPLWTMDGVFEFLEEAQAPRKVAVIGTISNYAASASRIYRSAALRALTVTDEVVSWGPTRSTR
jgi:UDP-N-acetylmuramyl pentapeptide synthase